MNTATVFCTTDISGKFINAFIIATVSTVALASVFIGGMALASVLGLWS